MGSILEYKEDKEETETKRRRQDELDNMGGE